ncbi:MAG: zinc ribbon domain-containing protein, partial [Lachnospiraceae bacterium]|nr:zinc ribbon domain-containing protein [Lachnospiraceae bacterium]
MFCSKCGTQLPDGAMFCTSCGNQLNSQPAAPM